MKTRYTLHALERMRQRGVNRGLVERCLGKPDKVEQLNDVYRCIKRIDKKVLVVIYRRTRDTIPVITASTFSKT